MSETLKFKIAEFRESEKAVEAEKFISEALLKKKRVQKTLKEQKKALSDFDRNVLMNQCLNLKDQAETAILNDTDLTKIIDNVD
ncbi:MAG: hypothetical protein LQ347_004636 [Umbilicaria vellea]|nr:MAG: hypothetical protein LQ347_004636 [Umbilicaria vellea]